MLSRTNKYFTKIPAFFKCNQLNNIFLTPSRCFSSLNYIVGKKINTIDRTLDFASKLENKGEYPVEFDLKEHFKLGFSEEELEGVDDKIRNVFTQNNASDKEILDYRKQVAIKKFQKHPLDVGSFAVKIAILTEEIIHKIKHFYLSRKKNMFLYRTIQQNLIARDKLLTGCRIKEPNYYKWVCDEYKIKYDMQTVSERAQDHHLPAEKATEPNTVKGNRRKIRQSKNNYPKNWPWIR